MFYKDLREWLQAVEDCGELLKISGASPYLEMSGIAEIMARGSEPPMPTLLFDDIPGFPPGYKTVFGLLASPRPPSCSENIRSKKRPCQSPSP